MSGSLDSAGDLLRLMGPGLLTEPRWALGPFITLHSVVEEEEEEGGGVQRKQWFMIFFSSPNWMIELKVYQKYLKRHLSSFLLTRLSFVANLTFLKIHM